MTDIVDRNEIIVLYYAITIKDNFCLLLKIINIKKIYCTYIYFSLMYKLLIGFFFNYI